MTLFRKITEKGEYSLVVNKLIYLTILMIFAFIFPLSNISWLELYKDVKFCGVS